MKQSDSMYSLWRRVHLRLQDNSDLEAVTEEANALLPRLEEVEDSIRSLVKQNVHLSKTLAGELKNLAADFERQAVSDRSALEQKLGDLLKSFEQKNSALQKQFEKNLLQQQQAADKNTGKLLNVIAGQNVLLDKERSAREQGLGDLLKSFEQENGALQKQFEKNLLQQQQAADENAGKVLGVIAGQNELLDKERSAREQTFGDLLKSFEQKNGALQKQFEKNLLQQQQAADKNTGKVLGVIAGQNELLDKKHGAVDQKIEGIEKSLGQKNLQLQELLGKELLQYRQAADENVGRVLGVIAKQNELLDKERKALDQKLGGIQESFEQKNQLLQKEFEKKLQHLQQAADESSGKLLDVVARQNELLKQEQKTMASKLDQACGAVAGVDGSLAGVKDYLAEQGQVQRRYQEGYDFQILKNFVTPVARVIDSMETQIEKAKGAGKKELESAREHLIDLLAGNGVEQIIPVIGDVVDDAAKETVEAAGTVDSSASAPAGTIAEVVCPGYRYTFTGDEEQSRCLQKAKIKVYCTPKATTKKPAPKKSKSEAE